MPIRRVRERPPGLLESFGENVRARRLELGLSQEALAKIVGVHRTYVGSLERGERNVGVLGIVRLAKVLEVDPASLLDGVDLDAES